MGDYFIDVATADKANALEITPMAYYMLRIRWGDRFTLRLLQQFELQQLSKPQLKLLIIQAIVDNNRDQFTLCESLVQPSRGQYLDLTIEEILYQLCEV